MPIYEFVCQDCGHEFERIQSWSDTTTPTCTACMGTNVLRNMSRPAVHFKGSGWYITDSKKGAKNSASDTSSDSKSDAKGEAKTASSTESKSETKSEAKSDGGDSAKVASGESKKESAPAAAASE